MAKNTFSLHGVDAHGKTVFRKTLSRVKLMPFLAQQPACLIGMEACSGAYHRARQLTALGHRVGIMAPKFVIPYRKGGKNDGNDDVALLEAARNTVWLKGLRPGCALPYFGLSFSQLFK